MSDWQVQFLQGCCARAESAALGEGAFAPGPAIWVGRREVAHFDGTRTLDVRLTKPVIRDRRQELRNDRRVAFRSGSSDWLEIHVETDEDVAWATGLVLDAAAANLATALPGPPPTGTDLARRRRFH